MNTPITEQNRRDQILNATNGVGEAIEAHMAPMNAIAAALGIGMSIMLELHTIANALEWQVEDAISRRNQL